MPNARKQKVSKVSKGYLLWLGNVFKPAIRVKEEEEVFSVRLLGKEILRLAHQPKKRQDNREVYFIIGGALAKRTDLGWLEFRSVLDNKYILAAIQEYVPRLPWSLYKATQAQLHLWVMKRFAKSLESQDY